MGVHVGATFSIDDAKDKVHDMENKQMEMQLLMSEASGTQQFCQTMMSMKESEQKTTDTMCNLMQHGAHTS